jgi:hypothetical protein
LVTFDIDDLFLNCCSKDFKCLSQISTEFVYFHSNQVNGSLGEQTILKLLMMIYFISVVNVCVADVFQNLAYLRTAVRAEYDLIFVLTDYF